MKRVLAWVLILQFATGHNLLAELARMPSLLEHYREHLQETPGLSYAGFVWIHYLEAKHTHSDNSHAQLPLHGSHGIMAESVLPQPPEVVSNVHLPEPTARVKMPVADECFSPADYDSGLFRPPIT